MADIIPFRRAKLTGFIPETEVVPPEFQHSDNRQGEREALIRHARLGSPGELPSDSEPQGAA